MINNFELIKDFIQTQWEGKFNENTDAFYTVEIIGRRKDGATIESRKFKTYFIKDIEDLYKYENEIKTICDILKMRAYISVNAKSWRKVTLNTMAEYADRIAHDNFEKPYSIFDSCTGKFVDRSNQLWIIDVDKDIADKCNRPIKEQTEFFKKIIENKCKPNKSIVVIIPTRTGMHIVCHPFDRMEFRRECFKKQFFYDVNEPVTENSKFIEVLDFIKENNPTLLYENLE